MSDSVDVVSVVVVVVDNLSVERRTAPLGIDAPQPRFGWRLIGDGADARQASYQIQLVDERGDWSSPLWDTGTRRGADSTQVPYDGPRLQSRGRYMWRVRVTDGANQTTDWSAPAQFEMGLLNASDWSARWIANVPPDLVSAPEDRLAYRKAPVLRRRFALAAAATRARLYITALGVYEASLNGARVGEERLAPGWTDYHARIQYQTFDVTEGLHVGDNVLEVRIGDGWYSGRVGAMGAHRYGDVPALLCQLEVQYLSGSAERVTIATDDRWEGRQTGTWLHDLQLGERTDFRDYAEDWQPATLRADTGARLVAARDDGIRVVETLPAASIRAAGPDRHIVDLGANAAGVLRVRTTGTPGQHIVLRHAEALDDQGELYVENLRGAEQQDEFILADTGRVVLEPQLTFHGFRYAEISGVDAVDVDYQILSSASRLVGSFTCSNPDVEKLQRNILTSLRANFISIPTDCPQRNERLGWTADLQIFAPTALFIADVTNMLEKWLDDMVDAQLPSGAYTDIVPAPSGWAGAGNTAWSDAGIIVPWVLYERSGDASVLERLYPSMLRFMRFLEADQTHGIRFAGRYGDWVSLGARTDKTFIGTAYLAYVADLFVRSAAVLGRSADEQRVRGFANEVRRAFQQRFLESDGRLSVETQTAYAMALGFGLLPSEIRPAAGDRLAELVTDAGTHLATGFLGTPIVMPALSDNGHHELACQLLQQDTYPSWLFEVRNGATSIWERWNGWTPDQGFYSPQMNSFNHYAFGAVGDWMYRYLAGLDPVEPGYRRTQFRPRPGANFTAARASHESMYGVHTCGWTLTNGTLHVEADVPANTTAALVLPDGTRTELAPGHHQVDVPYGG